MKKVILIAAVLCVAASSFALFRASDIVFVLAGANTPGAGGTLWQTDVWVTDPEVVENLLTIEYLPTGAAGNPTPSDTSTRYYVNYPSSIPPNGTLYIPNIIGFIQQTYPNVGGFGALIFYGEKPTGDINNLIVNSRTYTPKSATDPTQGYYGQDIPGTPWFYYIDSNFADYGLDAYWLVGLTENSAFRTNVGIVNGSENDILSVKFDLYDSTGTFVATTTVAGIGALAHVQYNQMLTTTFGLSSAENYSLHITIASATIIDSSLSYAPALYAYASKVDNATGDPNYIEATYFQSSTETAALVNCIWP